MSRRTKGLFWIAAGFGVFLFLYFFRAQLTPFVLGVVIAYLLNPLASRLERKNLSRTWATTLIFAGFSALFIMFIIIMLPLVLNQLQAMVEAIPSLWSALMRLVGTLLSSRILENFDFENSLVEKDLSGYLTQTAGYLKSLTEGIAEGIFSALNTLSLLFLTPVIAFYLLLDWEKMIAALSAMLPRAQAPVIRQLAGEMDASIAAFVRGQFLVCLILALFYCTGLLLIGLPYAIFIGFSSGFLSFIPYLGSILGLMMSLGVALWEFWPQDFISIFLSVAVFGLGQFIEGNVLQPKLVGKSVGLHPVWLMFSLVAFGSLFGFLGLLIAVPVSAAIAVLVRFSVKQYKKSRLYENENTP